MKNIFAVLAIVALLAGCHKSSGQLPPTAPPLATCPTPGNAAYTPLNPAGTASTSFTANNVTTQTCFIAQGTLNGLNSASSNVAGPMIGGVTNSVGLSLTCTVPSPNPNNLTCTGVKWVFSSAQATVPASPAVPAVGTPTSAMLPSAQLTVASK